MRTLMIHEFNRDFLKFPLTSYKLTFDDGLYTQYHYHKEIDAPKYFFISTNIICEGEQSKQFIRCSDAHKKAFEGDKSHYMTLDQILELHESGNIIGGHSHYHTDLNSFSTLAEKVDHIKRDTELMLDWFDKKLNIQPTQFCFPYNNDMDGLYKGLLKKYGFTDFYGQERTPIETLLHNEPHIDILYI